jgi:hypothetical protein
MIKRPTWILLILLVIAISAFFLVKSHPSVSTDPTPTAPGKNFLIPDTDGTLISLRIQDNQGNIVQMQRDPGVTWVMVLPTQGAADQALAGAAETQVGALLIVATLDTNPDLKTIGLEPPNQTIELSFSSGTKYEIEVGSATSINSGYYVRLDQGNVYVVSTSGIDSLLNLLTSPPYPPTDTPTPTIEMTATETESPETATATP